MSIDNTTDEALTSEQNQEEQQKKVETMEDAVRYAYGLSETRNEIAEIYRLAQLEIEKWEQKIREVLEWRDAIVKPLQSKEEYLEGKLLEFHVSQYIEAPNEKAQKKLTSIKLPYGVTLASTKPRVKLEVTDEAAYKIHMQESGYVEPQEPKLKWNDFKQTLKVDGDKVVTEEGEVIDFIKAVSQERKFEVK